MSKAPLRIFTVVGARPQFIKAAAFSRAIATHFRHEIQEYIVHTGQHYDAGMSEVFFQEMGIPAPAFDLHVGSASHGQQTARMLEGLEQIFISEKPDLVLVYGDTNSTLAGALAASKLGIPLVHVEAGLRSFNKAMPEEINRILTDQVSTLLFSPTQTGIDNLRREGFLENASGPWNADSPGIFLSGDVMYDNALYFREKAIDSYGEWFSNTGLKAGGFILATVHRNLNTDDPQRLKAILTGFLKLADSARQPILWPVHPRTRKMLQEFAAHDSFFAQLPEEKLQMTDPVGFLQMVLLESSCSMVLTDSGGVQKEAYFYEKPCLVLRSETEWTELVESGAARLADADENCIAETGLAMLKAGFSAPAGFYGDGNAAGFIAAKVRDAFGKKPE